jgi:hypothetical protein
MIGNPRIRKHNVLLTIGNVVSELVTTVTLLSNYIHTNAKVLVNEYMYVLNLQML